MFIFFSAFSGEKKPLERSSSGEDEAKEADPDEPKSKRMEIDPKAGGTTTTTTSTSTSDAPENNGSRHLNKRIINYDKQW